LVGVEDILFKLGNRSIFLTGFMGAGKTVVGFKLAEALDIPFYDLDHLIESREDSLVVDIFTSRGEGDFRDIENAAFDLMICEPAPNVISLGGGTLVDEVNLAKIRSKGILIGLKSSPEYLLTRLNESQIGTLLVMTGRPISDALFMDKIQLAVNELYEARKDIYDDVDFNVDSDGRNISDITEEILDNLESELF
jgi:shikimate kinase